MNYLLPSGIAWREVKCFRQQGFDIFTQFGHWRDIIMVMLFVFGVLLDVAFVLSRPVSTIGAIRVGQS